MKLSNALYLLFEFPNSLPYGLKNIKETAVQNDQNIAKGFNSVGPVSRENPQRLNPQCL